MNILPYKKYKIKGNSEYFFSKYKTSNPTIIIEGSDLEVFGRKYNEISNWAVDLFRCRLYKENIKPTKVFYGHVNGYGECVDISELEETDQ